MQLNLGDGYKGQYFTLSHIADFMAKVTLQDSDKIIKDEGFITLSEPTCGSGGMVIGCINALIEAGFNPQQQLWVECRDIDFQRYEVLHWICCNSTYHLQYQLLTKAKISLH